MSVKVTSRIPQIVAELQLKMVPVVEFSAQTIEAGAKERVPVDEGDLQRAIHTEHEEDGTYVVAGDDKVFYGHLVENGTVKKSPRPFLRPAFDAALEPTIAAAVKVLRGL